MIISVDLEKNLVRVQSGNSTQDYPLGSPEAFSVISRAWLRAGWDAKYVYSFTWLGRPVIQLPEDLLRVQEVIYTVKPDVIIETGVAHGGSLVFYASLCKALGRGRVIGIDIEIRPQNMAAIQSHLLADYITLIEGDSIDPNTVDRVRASIGPNERVFVVLDSAHTKQHVLAELRAYSPFVTIGSYIVAADGIMEEVVGAPRTQPDWVWNNPRRAALQFVEESERFVLEEPSFLFNEGSVTERVTYWPGGLIRRVG